MDQPLFSSVLSDAVRVALPVPVDELFDYGVPHELAENDRIHSALEVLGSEGMSNGIRSRGSRGFGKTRLTLFQSI